MTAANQNSGDEVKAAFNRRWKESITGEKLPFKTLVAIVFSEKSSLSTVEDIEKIVQEFELPTHLEILSKREKYLYIAASTDVLLKLADKAELIKKTKSGSMQKFSYYSKSNFLIGDMRDEEILRNSDCPFLVKDAIKTSLLPYIKNGTIQYLFPIHDLEYLKKFEFKLRSKPPVEDIRNYFGSSIGLYFAFLQFYTYSLVFPAIFGIAQYFLGFNLTTVIGFYVIWTTLFSEMWKRKCSALTYRWGTIEMTSLDKPRTAYYGDLKPDPITGKMTPQYPMRYTYIQMYCVSYPVVGLCVIAAAYFSLYQFTVEAKVAADFGADSLLLYVPAIVQSILIAIFSWAYERLATFLTDQENHRTRSQYERHRVNKLIGFEIVNNFFSLFYIAFVIQDLSQLKYQLMTQLIIFQIAQVSLELSYPLFSVVKQKYSQPSREDLSKEQREKIIDMDRYEQCVFESGLEEYNSTYEDFLLICTQFGYVVLFAAVAPFAAVFALICNFMEMNSDLLKLTKFYKRPFARRAKNIGAWQSAFEILSVLAILSNCGLLYLQPNIKEFANSYFPNSVGIAFIAFEHLLLAVKFCMHKAIHDKPRSVRIAMASADYESSLALKQLMKFKQQATEISNKKSD